MEKHVSIMQILANTPALLHMNRGVQEYLYFVTLDFINGDSFHIEMSRADIVKERDEKAGKPPHPMSAWHTVFFTEMAHVFLIKKLCKDPDVSKYLILELEN